MLKANELPDTKTKLDEYLFLKNSGDLMSLYKFLYSLEVQDLIFCLRSSGIHFSSDTEIKKVLIESCRTEINGQVRKALSKRVAVTSSTKFSSNKLTRFGQPLFHSKQQS